MIVTFCGHRQYCREKEDEAKVLAFLEEKIGDSIADIYLGGYGNFDHFAYACSKKYKQTHSNVSLLFITPYLREELLKEEMQFYDGIIYPEIEDKPLRFAISYRNKWMVEKADYVIAYITHSFGGAYSTYKHAKKCGKPIFNLAEFEQ